eukprot:c23827_g1_i2 orf=316-1290(+)
MVGKNVCVTGASGFIASWIVKFLLDRGYFVRAAVRYPDKPEKVSHLLNLEGAKDRLQLFKADLLVDGSFDDAINGCDGVFHTASPFFSNTTNPEADLLDPAVKGTLNVLRACAKAKALKRVVLTSSMAAVAWNPRRKAEDVVDESNFSDVEYLKGRKIWYQLSKTLAENSAWEFSKEKGLDLVAVNPGMVVGSILQPTMNTSSEVIMNMLTGTTTAYPNVAFGWVDVKDVANAHILTYEFPEASGRHICVERVMHYSELVDLLQKLYPSYPIPTKCLDEDSPKAAAYKINQKKLLDLGLKYTPIEQAIKECVDSLKARGLVPEL